MIWVLECFFIFPFNLTDVKGHKNRLVDKGIKPSKCEAWVSRPLLARYAEPGAQKNERVIQKLT